MEFISRWAHSHRIDSRSSKVGNLCRRKEDIRNIKQLCQVLCQKASIIVLSLQTKNTPPSHKKKKTLKWKHWLFFTLFFVRIGDSERSSELCKSNLFVLSAKQDPKNERKKKRKEIYSRKKKRRRIAYAKLDISISKRFSKFSGQSGEFFLSFPGGNFFRSSNVFNFSSKISLRSSCHQFQWFSISSSTFSPLFFRSTIKHFLILKNQQICTLGLFFLFVASAAVYTKRKKIAATNLFHFCQTLTITY